MIIFATPGWVAGYAMQHLLIVSAVVMAISAAAILLGVSLLRRGSTKPAWPLLLVGCLLPVLCYFVRPHADPTESGVRSLGNYPGNRIKEGMSDIDVKSILGPPHQRKKNNDRETWIYWADSYGGSWFGIDFGPDGRVMKTYGN